MTFSSAPRMSPRFRFLALTVAGLAAAAIAAYAAYWFHVAGQLRKGIDGFAADRRAEGWAVEMAAVGSTGFPGAVTARIGGLTLRSPAGLFWHAETLSITVPPLRPLAPVIDFAGTHDLTLPGWSGIISAAGARASLRVAVDGGLSGLAFDSSGVVVEQAGLEAISVAGASVSFDRLGDDDGGHEKPTAQATIAVRGIDLPTLAGLPLGRRIDTVQLEARIMGSISGGPPLAALAAWSTDGGTVELDRVVLEWAPLAIEADGTMALDPALQPLIATNARIRGLGEFVVRLVQAGLIEPRMASAAEIMLAIMARPDTKGRPTLSLPLTLQDGILSAGQIRLTRVPPLPIGPR